MAKLNKEWQKAADELPESLPGVQHMFDGAAAETDPVKRTAGLLDGFADNVKAISSAILSGALSVDDGIALGERQLKHTVKHFSTIAHTAKHGV